jgi:leucyl-tRNA synthetase
MGGGKPDSKPGGVDLYVGGTEHAVLHLLYARFWHKVLFDLGHVSTPEPFQRLVNQGLILGEDGQKMSKSRGNVVNPDDVIGAYGADAFRCYEMFMGPLEQMKPWSTAGVEGVSRFLARVWRLIMEENQAGEWELSSTLKDSEPDKAQKKVIHATIKKVGEDIEALSFNTAIAQMMIFVNAFTGLPEKPTSALRTLLQLLNPFAPHVTEELWKRIGCGGLLADQPWPDFDPQALVDAAQKAMAAWQRLGARERVGLCAEAVVRLNARSFEIAHAVMATTGQGWMMAFQAGGPHAQDRALEALAYAWVEQSRIPAQAVWEKPQGKNPPTKKAPAKK